MLCSILSGLFVLYVAGVAMVTTNLGWFPQEEGQDWRDQATRLVAKPRELTDKAMGNYFRLWNWARQTPDGEERSMGSLVGFGIVSVVLVGLMVGGFMLKKQIGNEVLAGMAGLAVPSLYFLSFTFELSVVNLVCLAMVMVEVMSGVILSAASNWKERILARKGEESVSWLTGMQWLAFGTIISIILMEGVFGYLRAQLEMDGVATLSDEESGVLTIFMVVVSMLVSGGTSFGSFFWEKLLVVNSWFFQVVAGTVANTFLVVVAYLGRYVWSSIIFLAFVMVALFKRDRSDDDSDRRVS